MNKPLVSIIVPTYNGSKFILETIDSLVIQTYSNTEILIVDDASTDSTIEILDKYIGHNSKISLIQRETNGGESAAINTGWRKSKGDYVSIISCDDPQDPTWLEKMVEIAESNVQHQFYYPNLRILDESGAIVQNLTLYSWSRALIFQKLICIASAGTLIRKSNLPKDFLPRDENIVYPSDLIQFLELSKLGSGLKADKVFGHWRRHNNSLTYNTDQVIRGIEFHKNVSIWIQNNEYEVYSNRIQIANARLNLTIQTLFMIVHQYGKFGTIKKVVSSKELIKIVIQPTIFIFITPKLMIKVIRKLITKWNHTFVQFYRNLFIDRLFLRVIGKIRYEIKRNKKIFKVKLFIKNYKSFLMLRKKLELKPFWEESHNIQSSLWLTGTPLQELIDFHEIGRLLHNNDSPIKVLNVGVGLGTCTRELSELGHEISALDISAKALSNVATYVKHSYLASSINELPEQYFDLIIHHLVAQHMSIKDFREQSNALLKSLKLGGLLVIQVATYLDSNLNDMNDSLENCKKGSVGRSEVEIRSIFNAEECEIVELKLRRVFEEYGSAWFQLKVLKILV